MDIVKVAIADDHKIFRKGVILSLRQYTNLKFVLEAENGEDLIQQVTAIDAENSPEVILMDLKMPVKDGIETTKYMNKHFPNIRIIILTMYEDERFVGHLMDSGANGYLLNNFVNKVLIKKNYAKQKFNPNLNSEVVISEREKEVLTLVCMEYTASEIASKMDISARTVEAIKDRLMERFGVKNSVGLVFYAMKNSLID